jgi:hypothetical protein
VKEESHFTLLHQGLQAEFRRTNMEKERIPEDLKAKQERGKKKEMREQAANGASTHGGSLSILQQQVGNRAVQRMLSQRSGGEDGPFDLDDETVTRINHARSSGQPLESNLQARMSEAMGSDFSDVKVHTSAEAADLSQQVGAVAFTTGNDIFFNQGAYKPHSGDGQELLAHELTHVVQQGSGAVTGGGSSMTVNAAGDPLERQADSVAKAVTSAPAGEVMGSMTGVHPQTEDDEVQLKAMVPDDEEDEEELKE